MRWFGRTATRSHPHAGPRPGTAAPAPRARTIRSEFIPATHQQVWRPGEYMVILAVGERIVSVESIPPNPAIGAGTRVWIERTTP